MPRFALAPLERGQPPPRQHQRPAGATCVSRHPWVVPSPGFFVLRPACHKAPAPTSRADRPPPIPLHHCETFGLVPTLAARAAGWAAHGVLPTGGPAMKSRALLSTAIAAAGISVSQPALAQPAADALGKVHFETFCTPDAHAPF